MPKARSVNQKASNQDIIRLNSLGLSLKTIAELLDVHPTTITIRLKGLGVEPADTRRTFMEDVLRTLSPAQQEWLADQLGPHHSVKEFVKNLLVEKYLSQSQS